MFKIIIAASLLACAAAPALSQVAPDASVKTAKPKDAKRLICETFGETGSRLSTKRVCMTAEDWRAQRQDHRNDIERAQKNVGIQNEGG